MDRPDWLFDREALWDDLTRFAARQRSGLAIVRGRRRHGKSVVLRALADRADLFYYQAIQGTATEQRRDLAVAYASRFGVPQPAFETWQQAVHALVHPPEPAAPVIIDELPYLTDTSPEFESVLQRALDAGSPRAAPIIVCGSAMSVMTRLLTGSAPLRGRAQLEVEVGPFDYRTAARFCGLTPEVAPAVHSVIGGVPGYATDLLDRTFPDSSADIERWLVDVVASVRRPLVHEARSMLEVEPGIREPGTYVSVLAAVAAGATRTGEIAGRIGRSADAVSHALTALTALGLVARTEDLLGRSRPSYTVADPLLQFYSAVLRPNWEWVERGDPVGLAARILQPWRSQVYGPHLEVLAREWLRSDAGQRAVTEQVARVGWGTVDDPGTRIRHELDLLALDAAGDVVAIGEAKHRQLTVADIDRLVHIRGLIPTPHRTRLILCSATGFDPGLTAADVELVDLPRLYAGV